MQRLGYLCTGTSRLFRVIGVNYLENSKSLLEKENSIYNTHNVIIKRCLASNKKGSKDKGDVDPHAELYKPSTAKQEQHVPDDLHSGQSPETFDTAGKKSKGLAGGKVWTTHGKGDVHIAPLGRVSATTFVPSSNDGTKNHEKTIYATTKGEMNFADPFKTHTLPPPDATPGQLAEAAAASAFEPFAPDTPLTSTPAAAAVFAPKVSSTDTYSSISSPTAHFQSPVSPSSSTQQPQQQQQQEPIRYEASHKPKVFGGQDTSADTKKHPKRNPFNLQEKIKSPMQDK